MSRLNVYLCFIILSIALVSNSYGQAKENGTFTAAKNSFELNGKPYLIRAAELHYPRIPKQYWEQRIQMCKAMGMNTICIYLFWNLHEQKEGVYNFEGQNDVREFIKLIQKNGMFCIVRPGPYVCAEWDMGGLPWWLLKKDDIQVRTLKDKFFIESASRYLRRVGKELSDLQIQNGGNIIMVQVENEYGVFGNDSNYMASIRDLLRESGLNKVQLFRCDWSSNFDNYKLDGVASTLNFGAGSKIDEQFKKFKTLNPEAPLMCSEYWTGWFDQWGRPHETRGVETFIGSLKDMLDRKISFSLYMAHGGTSFGQWAGANSPPYAPTISSYDYDAPITESGQPTDKFYAIRDLLKNYLNPGEAIPEEPKSVNRMITIPAVSFSQSASLFENLPKPIIAKEVKPMEYFGQGWGSILYRTSIPASSEGQKLEIETMHDYAMIYLDGTFIGKLDRRLGDKVINIPAVNHEAQLDIYIETTGRVNYGKEIIDRKGITGKVILSQANNKKELQNWKIYLFPIFDRIHDKYTFKTSKPTVGPAWYKSTFNLNETGDTFLDVRNWKKGTVFVNGHSLGRFWNVGPTQTMFVPGCWLNKGVNTVVVYDIYPNSQPMVKSVTKPIYENIIDQASLNKRDSKLDLSKNKPFLQSALTDASTWQTVTFEKPQSCRYICFEALNSQDKDDVSTSIAELELIGSDGKTLETRKWKIVYADSEEVTSSGSSADKIFDKQESVIWETAQTGKKTSHPHQVVLDLGEATQVNGFKILQRGDNKRTGMVRDFKLYTQLEPFNFIKN